MTVDAGDPQWLRLDDSQALTPLPLPLDVKVGPLTYTLDLISSGDGRVNYGRALQASQRIEINTSHPPDRIAQTLIHELFHVIVGESALHGDVASEEVAHAFDYSWSGLWADNPKLFAWIHEALTGGR